RRRAGGVGERRGRDPAADAPGPAVAGREREGEEVGLGSHLGKRHHEERDQEGGQRARRPRLSPGGHQEARASCRVRNTGTTLFRWVMPKIDRTSVRSAQSLKSPPRARARFIAVTNAPSPRLST